MPIPKHIVNSITMQVNCIADMQTEYHPYMPLDMYQSLFWSPQEQATAEAALALMDINNRELSQHRSAFVCFDHPLTSEVLPQEIGVMPVLTSFNKAFLPAKSLDIRDDAPADAVNVFKAAVNDIALRALNAALLKDTVGWLFSNCGNMKQVRYLFPAITYFMRRADLTEEAHELERMRKRPQLPEVPQDRRRELRWLIQWVSTMLLIDGFDEPPKAAVRILDETKRSAHVRIDLYGTQFLELDTRRVSKIAVES